MSVIDWTSDLETGIPFVDKDHKVLINLLNQVHECANKHEESMILGSVLSALIEYTDYHFSREEKLQELCGYAHFKTHKAAHATLCEQAQGFYQRYKAKTEDTVAIEVREFLRQWLIKHIMVQDFAFVEACKGNHEAIAEATAKPFMESEEKFINWSKLSVLLIDDNPNFRLLIETVLKALGVRNFKQATSADEGLAMLIKAPMDLILCDWVMDGMNGAEFSRKLREFDDTSHILLVTGHAIEKFIHEGKIAGVNSYLQKPITIHSLMEAIVQALK